MMLSWNQSFQHPPAAAACKTFALIKQKSICGALMAGSPKALTWEVKREHQKVVWANVMLPHE